MNTAVYEGRVERVVITGATGFVGSAVARRLAELGENVGAIARQASAPARQGSPNGVSWQTVGAWTRSELGGALEGAKAVVHCASVVHKPGAPTEEYLRFNTEGTRELVAACAAAGVRSFVFLSSIKVYGEHTTGILDEDTRVAPEGPYATSKADAERLIVEEARRSGMGATILRLCPVYGPGDKGNVRAMIRAIARRRFFVPGDGTVRKSIVHVSTVADVVSAAVQREAKGRTYVIADRVAPSMRELANVIANVLGRRRPPAVPAPIVYAGAYCAERASRLRGRQATVTPDLVRKALLPTVCSPARAEADLGVSCHVSLDETIRDEVAWLRTEGLLR